MMRIINNTNRGGLLIPLISPPSQFFSDSYLLYILELRVPRTLTRQDLTEGMHVLFIIIRSCGIRTCKSYYFKVRSFECILQI
jgi:hypothetical protein